MRDIKGKVYLHDIAYEKIKNLIILDQIKGPMVSESELATLLNMSRTPVRDALRRLQHKNFVEIFPERGVYIKEVTVKETNDLMDVRLAIELFSMNTISDIFSGKDYLHLEKLVEKQEESERLGNIYDFIKADLEYHEYLLEISGNEYFRKTLNNVSDRLSHHGMKIFKRDMARIQTSIEDHKIINNHLKEGEFTLAEEEMRRHIEKGKALYLRT